VRGIGRLEGCDETAAASTHRIRTQLPDQRTLHWLFYGSGHLHQINIEVDGRHELISDIERDALHREVGRSQGQLASQYEHDPQGRLLKHRALRMGAVLYQGVGKHPSVRLHRAAWQIQRKSKWAQMPKDESVSLEQTRSQKYLEWLQYRKDAFAEFFRIHPLPLAWRTAVARTLDGAGQGDPSIDFEFGTDRWLDDPCYLHILTLDESQGGNAEGGELFYVFSLWLMEGTPLDESPVVATVWTHNGDGTCSPEYGQETTAPNIHAFLRQLATGIAGRDQSTCKANVIDPRQFHGLAEAFANEQEALQSIEEACRLFASPPWPRSWSQ